MTPPLSRAVYIVSLFPCWSETFIVREIRALIDNGVDVRIISLKPPSETMVQPDAAALMDRVRHPGTAWATLGATLRAVATRPSRTLSSLATIVAGTWRRPAVLAKSVATWMRALEQTQWLAHFKPQFLHAHWATYPSTAAWTLSRVIGTPFGFTCHAHDIFVERQMIARKIEDAAVAVTISRFNVDWLAERETPVAARRLQVIHCGVDLDAHPWQPDGRDAGEILAVGRLDPIKGFATLLEALALLKQRGVAFRCRLVGSGPLESELRTLAADKGLDEDLVFAGVQPQQAIRDWMASASVFVLPSEVAADGNRDGIPVALMEAMATGCAVVSTRVSGIPELIEHERDGLLVEQKQPAALADALQRMLGDAALRERTTASARTVIERRFNARVEARRLQSIIEGHLHGA